MTKFIQNTLLWHNVRTFVQKSYLYSILTIIVNVISFKMIHFWQIPTRLTSICSNLTELVCICTSVLFQNTSFWTSLSCITSKCFFLPNFCVIHIELVNFDKSFFFKMLSFDKFWHDSLQYTPIWHNSHPNVQANYCKMLPFWRIL